jgi:hypothetical protein
MKVLSIVSATMDHGLGSAFIVKMELPKSGRNVFKPLATNDIYFLVTEGVALCSKKFNDNEIKVVCLVSTVDTFWVQVLVQHVFTVATQRKLDDSQLRGIIIYLLTFLIHCLLS